jgi:hypothetical protein
VEKLITVDKKGHFILRLNCDWFNTNDILNENIVVLSNPKPVIHRWWKRWIYKLTFGSIGKGWIQGYEHDCRFKNEKYE